MAKGYVLSDDTGGITNIVLTNPDIDVGSDATGDTYYRDGSGEFTRLGIGSTGDVLTVAGGLPSWAAPSGGATIAYKSSDQTSIPTSYTDITSTGVSIAANTSYGFEWYIIADTNATGTGLDVALNGPASPTSLIYEQVYWTTGNRQIVTTGTYDNNTAASASDGTAPRIYRVRDTIVNGANAGTLIARCKRESGGSGNIRAGTYGSVRQIS